MIGIERHKGLNTFSLAESRANEAYRGEECSDVSKSISPFVVLVRPRRHETESMEVPISPSRDSLHHDFRCCCQVCLPNHLLLDTQKVPASCHCRILRDHFASEHYFQGRGSPFFLFSLRGFLQSNGGMLLALVSPAPVKHERRMRGR